MTRQTRAPAAAVYDKVAAFYLFGPELNRRTERNVEAAGLRITEVRRRGIWREIVATPERSSPLAARMVRWRVR
jgi:hypothetical protein